MCRANNHRTEAMEKGTDGAATTRDALDHTDGQSSVQNGQGSVGGHGGEEVDLPVDSTPRPPPLGVPIVTTSRAEPTRSCINDVVFEEQPKATGVSELTGGCRCSGCTCTVYVTYIRIETFLHCVQWRGGGYLQWC